MKFNSILVTCLVSVFLPFINFGTTEDIEKIKFESLSTFDGSDLIPTPMNKIESTFYKDFPGTAEYYFLENRSQEKLLLRYMTNPSRYVHSIRACYKAEGTSFENEDNILIKINELSDTPLTWSQFIIQESDQLFVIRETILSLENGKNYADIPSWYWLTTFSSEDNGPWLVVTWKSPLGS